MRVWRVQKPGPLTHRPLRLTDEPRPEPADGELLVRVLACGVCRTDLHLVEGDLPVHREHVTPGHEVVGEVVEPGEAFRRGDKVGSRGCAARVITVASAGAGTRTCARNPTTPVGTWTADTPTTRRSPSRTPCRCRTTTATSNWRRCCARGSSASRRSSVRSYPRAGGSASTASAPALTLPRRSRSRRGQPCTC